MDLYLHESVALLGLDDEKGTYSVEATRLNYAFVAAGIMDLVLQERMVIEDGKLIAKNSSLTGNSLLNELVGSLTKMKKAPKMTRFLHGQMPRINKLWKAALDHLIRQGILKQENGKILWVFNVKRYPSVNTEPENQLRTRLHQVIFEDAAPSTQERILLSLLLSSDLLKAIVPDKAERKIAKAKIKALTEDSEMRKLLGNAMEEMRAFMALSVTTASI